MTYSDPDIRIFFNSFLGLGNKILSTYNTEELFSGLNELFEYALGKECERVCRISFEKIYEYLKMNR